VRRLLFGGEAVARGAYEHGVRVVTGHPCATVAPILEAAARHPELACERTPSERVAVEAALGACHAGARAVAVAAGAGLNVAADPLFASAYVAAAGGLVIVAIDDPGMHASAMEQDLRWYARAAKIPCVEPSDSQECKDYLGAALSISERYETPVFLRLTTRLAATASPVEIHGRESSGGEPRLRSRRVGSAPGRAHVEERLAQIAAHALDTPLNRFEVRSGEVGVVTSGLAYQHVREVLPEASVLKLGLSFPVPARLLRDFASRVRRLLVVEDLEPFIEGELRAMGIRCEGKDRLPRTGELTPALLARAFAVPGFPRAQREPEIVSPRPSELCAGCPHRATLAAIAALEVPVTGALTCPELGACSPDAVLGSGAAIATARGEDLAQGPGRRVVTVLDGRALLRSGFASLVHAAETGLSGAVVVADLEVGRKLDVVELARACGAARVRVVDPLRLESATAAISEELGRGGLSVVVARSPCQLGRERSGPAMAVEPSLCNRCGACLRLGCPAISDVFESMSIDEGTCRACGLCARVCRPGAIAPREVLA